jgi:hypothetical protein
VATNPYLDTLNLEEQRVRTTDSATGAPPKNPYLDTLEADEALKRAQQQAALRTAAAVNPDEAAKASKLAASRGLPQDVVLRNLQDVQRQDSFERADTLLQGSPALAAKMRDLPFAQVAHDNVENLSAIESAVRYLVSHPSAKNTLMGDIGAGVQRANRGAAGVFQAVAEFPAPLLDFLEGNKFGGNPLRRLAEGFAAKGAASERKAEELSPPQEGNIAGGISSGVQSFTQNMIALPLALLPGGQGAALTMMVGGQGGQSYQDAREKGLSMPQALPYAASQAAIEYATEKIPLARLIGDVKVGTSFFKTLVRQAAVEIPGEQVATILQDMNEWAVLPENKSKPFSDYLAERPNAAAQTLIATIVGTGGNVTLTKALAKVSGAEQQTQRAEQDAKSLGNLLKLSEKDKLRERDPTAFASMVQAAAEQHGVPGAVYIDAGKLVETLAQSGMKPEQIEAALPSTKAQLAEAVAAGGDAIVPIGEFTALVAGSGLEAQLVKHARLSPDALSQEDAKTLAKIDLKVETEKVMAQQEAVVESKAVRDQVFEHLSLAGRFSPSVNEAYADAVAALYETQAARLGISVAEFAKRYPLNVTGVAGTQQKLDQGERVYAGTFKDKQGRDFGVEITREMLGQNKDTPSVNVSAMFEGGRRGRIDFGVLPDGTLAAENTMVAGIFRGAGIAEGMYRAAREAGFDIAPGRKQTEQGDKMVASLLAKGVINKPRAGVLNQDRRIDEVRATIEAAGVDVTVNEKDGVITLSRIVVPKGERAAGKGTAAMQALTDYADRTNQRIALSPSSDFGGSKSRLVDFYKRFGFVPNKGRSKDFTISETMVREPKPFAQDADPKGTFTPSTSTIALLAKADLSTFHHELGHFYLEALADMAAQPDAPASVVEDMNKVLEWFGIKGGETVAAEGSKTGELNQLLPDLPAMQRKIDQQRRLLDARPDGHPLRATGERALARLESEYQSAQRAAAPVLKKLEGTKIVEADGRPKVVYHGGGAGVAQAGKFRRKEGGRAIWFADASVADTYAAGEGGALYPVYLNASNPLTFDAAGATWQELEFEGERLSTDGLADIAEARGHDALIIKNLRDENTDDGGDTPADHYAVFKPEQIVSATSGETLAQDGPESGPTEPVTPKATPLDTWRSMSLDQQREFHEKFARGYEAYLFEGKAPSTALARTFQRFSEWMRRIYRSIKALNVEINDDIRRVYDRMLASEEAIKEAEAARAYAPLFNDAKTLKEAGVDPAAYHALAAEATAEAVDRLQARGLRDMRWLSNAKNKALKALQKDAAEKRKIIEAQVREEVNARPEYRAADLLKEADKEFKDDPFSADPGVRRGAIADALGFTSVDAMAQAIENAQPRKQVIEGLTDQRMLEEHGGLSSPEALERAAEQAIRNEARGKFIATELAALNKALGPARVLVTAAKQFAESVIGRKTLTDIKPHVFAAAETRAAKMAEKLLGKSTEEAATAKRNQLLNHYAARYAHDAVGEIAKVREFFARVANTPDDRLKTRDMDVVNAARAVLAAYGVGRKGEAAAEYLKKVAAYDPDMSQVLQGSVDAAMQNAKPLDELTLDELRALNDEVASLWHLAKRSRQMEVDGDLMDREEVQEALKDRLTEIGIPDTMPGDASAITPAEQRLAKFKTYLASARRTESWVGAMDGADSGVFRSYIWQPVKEAADAYRTDKARLLKRFRELLDPIRPSMRKRIVDAPELGYTFGKDTGGVALNEILHAVLHTGNSSNKRKLLLGRKWATELPDGTLDTSRWDAFIKRMADEGVLTKAHFDFVQGVWDLLEETKPLAQKTHRDVFGKYFAEVTAEPVATPFGEYRGGYVPAQADPRVVSDAKTRTLMEEENASMAFAFPATARGFTKGRVEYNRPLTLDLATLAQHIDKVLLFGHMERPIRDVRRVLTSKGVAYGVNRIDPAAFDAIISPWLNRAARQTVTTPSPGHWQSWRLWSTLRNRAGMAAMFGNVVNAAQQITGFTIAAVKVRPKYLVGAMAHYAANPRQMSADVVEASPYMAGRISNEVAAMNDAIKDILINPGLYEQTQQWTMRHAYFMQSAVDNVMSPIIWIAARNQALEQGQDEREAGRFADATVRQTQGSTLPEDISNWEGGSSFSRMFSQFAGYFNMQANLLGTEFQTISRDMGLRKGAGRGLYVTLMAFLVPAWVSEIIVQAFRGGPDDEDKDGEFLDDWLQAVFGMATLRGATAMIPIFGQVGNAVVNAGNSKPYDDRLATSPAISMIESAVKAPWTLYKAMFEDGDKSKSVKDVASLVSLTTGIPANIAARPLSYAADVQEGDVVPTGPADMARGLVTGRASPASK